MLTKLTTTSTVCSWKSLMSLPPFRTFQSKVGKNPKWISNELKNLRNSKHLAHCKWKKTKKNVHLEKFKLRYKFENLVRINKKRYYKCFRIMHGRLKTSL